MKILRIIPSMNPRLGGPSQGIRNMIPELQKQGITNDVVCFDAKDSEFLSKDTFKIYALGNPKGPWSYNADLKPWLLKNLTHYDLVIIHGLWLYHSYCAWQAIRTFRKANPSSKIRVYAMPHGMLDPWFQKGEGRKLKAIRNILYWNLVEKWVINGVDGILFTCEQELELAEESFSSYNPKSKINIGYGIQPPPGPGFELDETFSQQFKEEDKSTYLLFLSRIHPKKGIDRLIMAYLQLKKKGHVMPKLIVAGPGIESEFGQEILKLANNDADIIFTGMLTGSKKWEAIYHCKAFVLPSHQENFGIAVVESLACGKPVLISNQVNIWKEIKDGKAGWILNEISSDAIGQSLLEIIQLNQAEIKVISQNAINLYQNKFKIENIAKDFIEKLNIKTGQISRSETIES